MRPPTFFGCFRNRPAVGLRVTSRTEVKIL